MMDRLRLETIAPDLVLSGTRMSGSERKRIAHAASVLACEKSNVHMPSYLELDRANLSKMIEDYDERYFDIIEKNHGLDSEGAALRWFHKARAIAALLFALDAESGNNFFEALYEAQAAIGDIGSIRSLIR